ncbi:hypothetical protein GQ602_004298 [Ophiocordyceps camponoti-floridani]|uniref:Uncharacterized protein n=1 Tax=Ophiocordyceps camponoti-floridani TaxID=2030778 RepID=A0A8H4Q6S1_9HYPO|nr:hypothetical protein GQ602_004298 [Ophiocordyceps camponoti-floridani]
MSKSGMVATRKSARTDIRSAHRRKSGPVSRRRRRASPSSSNNDDQGSDFHPEDDAPYPGRKENKRGRKRRAPLTDVDSNDTVLSLSEPSRRGSQEPRAKSRQPATLPDDHEPTSLIPNWKDARITFDCWTNIFFFAATSASVDGLSTGWLVQAATSCQAFAEPALTALYRCPPIKNTLKAKRLAALLDRPPSETLFNYRVKVEALYINVHIVPQTLMYQLVHPLGRLKELLIYTPLDQPPYRELERNIRWQYAEDVFRSLAAAEADSSKAEAKSFPTILESWEWSGRFIGGYVADLMSVASIHETRSFSSLTKLSFTNFQLPSLANVRLRPDSDEEALRAEQEDGQVIEAVAHAISRLKYLDHLVFESSTVLNDRLLPLLPKNLAHLELINCWEVNSKDLAEFLITHGSRLRTLNLMHNQSLDLSFLTTLSETCPNLRELRINMSYYRHHESFNDSDPMYEWALLPTQVPQWPPSLRVISIEHIRNWTVEAAEVLFQSLINSAPRLPCLRHLSIKTRLDIPWQVRATMRREWRATMETVFLRPTACPRPHTSLHTPITNDVQPPRAPKRRRTTATSPPSRRSGRIAAANVGSRISSSKRLRRRQQARPSYKDPDTDEDEAYEEDTDDEDAQNVSSADSADGETGPTIQGLCETVNLQFDNQKVRELQWGMEDFLDLDDKVESEDEWEGDED